MHCRTLLNRSARALRLGDADGIRAELERLLSEAGLDGPVDLVEPDALANALQAAVAAQPDIVLVGGGDGTVSSGAAAVLGTDTALGVLPLGTRNHFARDLGLSPDYREAAAQLGRGDLRAIDLGEVNGHVFVNNSVLGLYPEMVVRRERERSAWGLPKWLAMVLATARTVVHFHRLSIRLEVGGTVHRVHVPVLGVANNLYDEVSGLTLHRSRLDRGRLGIYLAHARSPVRLVRAFAAALGRKGGIAAHATVLEAEACVVSGGKPDLMVANDGEVRRLALPLHYRIRPRAIRVLAPAGFDGASAPAEASPVPVRASGRTGSAAPR